jgi:hypothetical protein
VRVDLPSGEWEIAYLTNGAERQLLPARSAAILTERS